MGTLCGIPIARVFRFSNKAESFQKTPEHFDVPSTKRLYGTSLRNFFHILPDMLLLRIDVYLIELFLPPLAMRHQLGLYQAGARVAELILMLPGTLNAGLVCQKRQPKKTSENRRCFPPSWDFIWSGQLRCDVFRRKTAAAVVLWRPALPDRFAVSAFAVGLFGAVFFGTAR